MIFDLFPFWNIFVPWRVTAGTSKMMVSKSRNLLFQGDIVRFHLKLWEFSAEKQGIEKILAGANHTQAISNLLVI